MRSGFLKQWKIWGEGITLMDLFEVQNVKEIVCMADKKLSSEEQILCLHYFSLKVLSMCRGFVSHSSRERITPNDHMV